MRTEFKEVSWRNMRPGDIIHQFKCGNKTAMGSYKVLSANVGNIVLQSTYHENAIPETYNPEEFKLIVECTEEEFRERYHKAASEVVEALQNTISYDAIGEHEIWNGWLGIDAYEFAQIISKEDFKIIDVCYDIPIKHGLFDDFDIAVVIEYSDGERFWCHYKSQWLSDIFEDWGVGK